ncbi:3-oxoacyl-ACP reductase [Fredinandcohnia onubensis]|uniref:3-oxoacyl-ACP reductase n=1 Tax=Fredinandcohnia onubensis TaxID=1571209 RepID=UPI000C0BE6D9|nr:3-oxoacyl-ACP reductase [Fredinandcohnia onubensis]
MKLQNQVILVTGGARGLGKELVKAFANEGAKVVINYFQSEAKALALQDEIGENAIAIQADVRNREQVQNLFVEAKNYFDKPITTVVNNALINFRFDPIARKNAENISWEDFHAQLEGAIKGALHTTQAALPDMKELGFGRIVTIGTNLFQNPVVAYHDYNTSKAALLGFTRNMAKDLGPYGINVNMISGGLLQTTDASSATSKEVFQLIKESTPLQKVTTPEDVANAVLFFASPWGKGVTGQNLIVDGGLVMN